MNIECDGKVYNPLGGGSYVFEKDIANFLLQKFTKDNIVISIGAQPNSSPHFGTLIVFSTAFSLAKRMKEINPNLNVNVSLKNESDSYVIGKPVDFIAEIFEGKQPLNNVVQITLHAHLSQFH